MLAQLTEQLSPEQREQLFAQLTAQLSDDEREALLAQLNEQLSPEQREQLFAQLLAQLPAAERELLLNTLSDRLTPEQRAALLADFSQRSLSPQRAELAREAASLTGAAAQTRDSAAAANPSLAAQPAAEQATRAALSQPFLPRDRLWSDGRPGLTSLQGDPRATVSIESSRALLEASTAGQATREPLAPSLRELLGLNLLGRDGFAPQQGNNPGGGDTNALGLGIPSSGLASYGAIAGGQGGGAASLGQSLSAPLHSPAWPQQLGQQLLVMSQRGGDQRVELRLNPPDLGPLTVSLKVGEQGTQIQFLSANAQVRGVVEQAIPQLREALAEQGINLGETSVGEQHQEEDQGFAGSDAQRQAPTAEPLLT